MRELFSAGLGQVVDEYGIDWWELASMEFHQQLEMLMKLKKIALEIDDIKTRLFKDFRNGTRVVRRINKRSYVLIGRIAHDKSNALPSQEIFRHLSRAMRFDEAELYESDRAIIASLLSQAGAGLGFEELAEVGTIHVPQTPAVQFEDLRFPTPSGKIRIAGDCFSDAGLPQAPFPSAEARPGAGDLRLLSPASEWLMNSSFGNEAKVVRQLGKREVFLSSIEAGARNLKDGDLIELGNQTGTLIATLGISDTVPTGVALLHKSRWPKGDEFRANVNVLNPGRKSDLAESCAVHSIDVSLNRA